jgi:hypothetical protein
VSHDSSGGAPESFLVAVAGKTGRWRLALDPVELGRAAADLRDWMTGHPQGISLTDGSGRTFDHRQLGAVADEAVSALLASIDRSTSKRRGLGASDLVVVASAGQNLAVVASLAVAEGAPAEAALEIGGQLVLEVSVALDQRFVRRDDGTFTTNWPPIDRALLEELTAELDAALASSDDDEDLVRLFPPAYGTDEDRSREYAALARDELVASRRAALEVLREALERDRATAEELSSMMRAVNDLRLVIGTRLDLSEETRRPRDDAPEARSFAIYEHLTHLLSQLIDALRTAD